MYMIVFISTPSGDVEEGCVNAYICIHVIALSKCVCMCTD